jgi:uncharacterized protein YvpB
MTNAAVTPNASPTSGGSVPPVYAGPKEVLVNQAVTLKGSYDASRATRLTLFAEDKFSLPVTLNAGTWEVNLVRGFSTAGSRWLRLRAFDAAGKEVDNKVFYITVSADPLTVGQSLSLKVLRDTFFKSTPTDSSSLNDQQKVLIKGGQTFTVNRYGFLDGHLKLELGQSISPIGNFGYFYEDHVQLSKGTQVLKFNVEDVPDTPMTAQLMVTATTLIKAAPSDSTTLKPEQRRQIGQGQTYQITGYACTRGHWRVTLAEAIPGFGTVGFIYFKHAKIVRNGKEVPYDSSALTIAALRDTIIKKRPVDSAQLKPNERANFNTNTYYGVSSYTIQGGHIKVALTEELPGFGNTGYVYPDFAQMRRGNKSFNPIPAVVELNVPYLSQRDNPRLYWSTCNVTSIAMAFYYYGVRSKDGGQLEDELLQWCLNKGGEGSQTNHNVLSELVRSYGFKSQFSTRYTFQDVKDELTNGRPVILCGMFTHGGHIVTAIGYTPSGYIINDPWGDALTGYTYTEGRKLLYPYSYIKDVCGSDGEVWAHFIAR